MKLNEDIDKAYPFDGGVAEIPATMQLWFNKFVTIKSIYGLIAKEFIHSDYIKFNEYTEENAPKDIEDEPGFKYIDEGGVEVSIYDKKYWILEWIHDLGGHAMEVYKIVYNIDGEDKTFTFNISLSNFEY